eukprot:scaffold109923_cov30-Tisochrysis_lutea.AAC.2
MATSDKAGRVGGPPVTGSGKPASFRQRVVNSRSDNVPEWSVSSSFSTAWDVESVKSMPSSFSTPLSSFLSSVPERFLSCLANIRPMDSSVMGAATAG